MIFVKNELKQNFIQSGLDQQSSFSVVHFTFRERYKDSIMKICQCSVNRGPYISICFFCIVSIVYGPLCMFIQLHSTADICTYINLFISYCFCAYNLKKRFVVVVQFLNCFPVFKHQSNRTFHIFSIYYYLHFASQKKLK